MFQFHQYTHFFYFYLHNVNVIFFKRIRKFLNSEAIVDKPREMDGAHFTIHLVTHLFACSEIAKWGGKSAPLSQKGAATRWDSS